MGWKDDEKFGTRLANLLKNIDKEIQVGRKVNLIGISAGGSMALNVFAERQNTVNKVINVCGRLRSGIQVRPSLERASREIISFRDSVLKFEQSKLRIDKNKRVKIITIKGLYDEIVPVSTVILESTSNRRLICIGHSLTIFIALTFYLKNIFLMFDL